MLTWVRLCVCVCSLRHSCCAAFVDFLRGSVVRLERFLLLSLHRPVERSVVLLASRRRRVDLCRCAYVGCVCELCVSPSVRISILMTSTLEDQSRPPR